MMKRKTIMSQEMLEKLVKKKQISLNSYFGCPLSFHKAKNDNKTKKTVSFSILRLLKYKTRRKQDRKIFSTLQCKKLTIVR